MSKTFDPLESALYTLEHSDYVYALLQAHRRVLGYRFEHILKLVGQTRYNAIAERFERITGIPFDTRLDRLVTEDEFELALSVELSEAGVLDTIHNNPTVRWIRTLNGELYVDKRKLTKEQLEAIATGKLNEVLNPTTNGENLTLPEELSNIRLYRTNVGVLDKFTLLKEMSIYGKEDRGFTLAEQLSKGTITMKEYTDKLNELNQNANSQFGKAGYIGQPVLTPAQTRAKIDEEARKWTDDVLMSYRKRNPASDDTEYFVRTLERMKQKPMENNHDQTVQKTPETTTTEATPPAIGDAHVENPPVVDAGHADSPPRSMGDVSDVTEHTDVPSLAPQE